MIRTGTSEDDDDDDDDDDDAERILSIRIIANVLLYGSK